MDWHGLIEFNKKYQPLYGFQGILLFPNAGRTNFPYSQGITKIDEEKIIQNIKLQTERTAIYKYFVVKTFAETRETPRK